jgi:hypothetical protein
MALLYEDDHAERALEDTQARLSHKPNIEALIRALSVGVQLTEDLALDYVTTQLLDDSTGYLLDRFGAFVGAQRLGATDHEYRKIIRARIAAQRSNGTIGEIGHVLDLLVDAGLIEYFPAYPAGYRFYFVPNEGELTADEIRRAQRILELARPAGVEASFVEAAGSDNETFRFDVTPGFGRRFGRLI